MTQQEMREKVRFWHEYYYTPYSKIAANAGLTPNFLTLFAKGERNLGEENKERLEILLINKNI